MLVLSSSPLREDYSNYFKSRIGFQEEVNEQLYKEANVTALSANRKFCGIIIDEMKVKENLVYDKLTGEVVGFISLGDINDELLSLERECTTEQYHPPIAKYLLGLIVRGLNHVSRKKDLHLLFNCNENVGKVVKGNKPP